MPSLAAVAGLAAVFAVAWALTAWVRRYALAAHMLDHPNERSSHSVPTPRGGGIAIVLGFLGYVAGVAATGRAPDAAALAALFGGGLTVALAGFLDDRGHLPARWRFAVHAAAATWAMVWLGALPKVVILGAPFDLGVPGWLLAVVYVIWMVNLYNFMDGIDGIAGVEAITVALGGSVCWWIAAGSGHAALPLALAAASAGFLVWNWPPARIFMGDSGSGFVGYVLAFFSLWSAMQESRVFWCWFILLGCFMVDATTTLVRRVRRGDRFHEAHRSHAYQYASRRHASHAKTTLAVGLINLCWLFPLALAVAWRRVDGVLATIVAYAPLTWLAFRYRAGDKAAQAEPAPRSPKTSRIGT